MLLANEVIIASITMRKICSSLFSRGECFTSAARCVGKTTLQRYRRTYIAVQSGELKEGAFHYKHK